MSHAQPIYLVSACLVGLCTRYDGQTRENLHCANNLGTAIWIPICPEQLGGLPTPREAADILDGDGRDVLAGHAQVLTKSGADVTAAFIKGAEQVLQIAQAQNIQTVFLKAGSPSCGVSGRLGVTAALLKTAGFQLIEF